MINQRAIQRFLDRPLDGFDWIKKYTRKQLLVELAGMKPVPSFGSIVPWLHQYACFLIILTLKRFLLNLDMGSGKTVLMLMLIIYRKQCGEKPRAIVFVPYITGVETWSEQVAEHAPALNCVPLLGTTKENMARLQGPGDLFVICYHSALAMVSHKEYSKKKGKEKWNFKAKEIRSIFADFDMLVMDEVHKCASASSLTYRMCRAISSNCDWVFGLTGTPIGKDVLGLWPQFYIIDFGETLGPTLEFFKAVFFRLQFDYRGYPEWKFRKRLLPDLTRIIQNRSIYYAIEDLHDMPEFKQIIHNLPAPSDSEGYVEDAVFQINEAIKGGAKSAYRIVENNYLRLRQLSSGFMTLHGQDSEKIQIAFEDNPKLDDLVDLIGDMPQGRKMVVFHHFRYTNQLISGRLKNLKIGHARIWGGERDPIGQLKKFKRDDKCIVLLLNDKSGSSQLNLQNANYLVFFEQPDDPRDKQQAKRRVWRPGQRRRVFCFDFLVKSTKDHALYKANEAGEDLLQELLAGRAKL